MARIVDTMRVRIDGDLYTVDEVEPRCNLVRCGREEFYMFPDSASAGKVARERWADMAENDPREFACMVGTDTLIQWGLGRYAGPGSTHVRSLSEWLDLWLTMPEEELASYDGNERAVNRVGRLSEELGFVPTVAYRCN